MTAERDPSLPPWLSIERQYDADDQATASALVELIRYSEARGLAEQTPPDILADLAAEAGLPPVEVHRAVCQARATCPFCMEDAAPKEASR